MMASHNSSVRKQLGIAGRSEQRALPRRRALQEADKRVGASPPANPRAASPTSVAAVQRTREALLRERAVLTSNIEHCRQARARLADARRSRPHTDPTQDEQTLGRKAELMQRRLCLIDRWLASHPTLGSQAQQKGRKATNTGDTPEKAGGKGKAGKDTAGKDTPGEGKAKGKGKKSAGGPRTSQNVRRGRVLAGAPTGRNRQRATLIS